MAGVEFSSGSPAPAAPAAAAAAPAATLDLQVELSAPKVRMPVGGKYAGEMQLVLDLGRFELKSKVCESDPAACSRTNVTAAVVPARCSSASQHAGSGHACSSNRSVGTTTHSPPASPCAAGGGGDVAPARLRRVPAGGQPHLRRLLPHRARLGAAGAALGGGPGGAQLHHAAAAGGLVAAGGAVPLHRGARAAAQGRRRGGPRTAMKKLRIVILARQKRVLERWTNPKPLQPIWDRAAI
jgi:hypothetical protein